MTSKIRGEVRRSQLITTYGIGAVIALDDESFMVVGTDRWAVDTPDLHEPRLERSLGVRGFVQPPASERSQDVPVVRFPRYSSCPGCNRIDEHRRLASNFDNRCNRCEVPLVPSRFVIACERGHIDDFPYFSWAHQGRPPATAEHELTMESAGRSSSLRDIIVRCKCGAWRDLEHAFRKGALKGVSRCKGSRPWLSDNDAICDELPRVLQRGASNVWFANVRSAISIPPWSERALRLLNHHWNILKYIPVDALKPTLEGMGLTKNTSASVDDLADAVIMRLEEERTGDKAAGADLRRQEYDALVRGRSEDSSEQDFVCVPTGEQAPAVSELLEQVMVVRRLREVRALTGFTRVRPGETRSDTEERLAPLAATDMDWLPAIEVRGEGVFLRLDSNRVAEWEARPEVLKRATVIDRNYEARARQFDDEPDRRIEPRFLLVHTLAHALIDQWALDSGYGAGSLRERLYIDDDAAGLLIYTATSDAAGSLGGLAAQAQPHRMSASLAEAVDRASWCSSDPLCIEADASGVDALNLGACHSCCLLPEVSCEEMNVLLDRAMLVGTPEEPGIGYFPRRG